MHSFDGLLRRAAAGAVERALGQYERAAPPDRAKLREHLRAALQMRGAETLSPDLRARAEKAVNDVD